MKVTLGVIVAIALTLPLKSQAFEWVSLIPTISNYVKTIGNGNKAKKIKKQIQDDLKNKYAATHSKALSDLKFMAGWEEVSAHASAISTVAEQLLFLEPLSYDYEPDVSPYLFFQVLTPPRAKALAGQCEELVKIVRNAVPKIETTTIQSESLVNSAVSVKSACDEIVTWRTRFNDPHPTLAEIRAALPAEYQLEIEKQFNAYARLLDGSPIVWEVQGETGAILQKEGSGTNVSRRSAALNKVEDEVTNRVALAMMRTHLIAIRDGSNALRDLLFAYNRAIFQSLKLAQSEFAKSLNEIEQVENLAKIAYPATPWSEVVVNVLDQVHKGKTE